MTILDPLQRFTPPRASGALRVRVLASARAAVTTAAPVSVADKIWFSPRWRLAWVAALTACAVIEILSVRATLAARGPSLATRIVIREADAAAAEIGFPGRCLIGDRIVTNSGNGTRGIVEKSL